MTSIIDTEQSGKGRTTRPEGQSPTPERTTKSVVGWTVVAVVVVATATLLVAVLLPSGSSADSDRAPATSVAQQPDLVERWAESSRLLLEACRRGEISNFRGEDCPMPTAPGFQPGRQGGQPRNAR
jgi:hypothetical protein